MQEEVHQKTGSTPNNSGSSSKSAGSTGSPGEKKPALILPKVWDCMEKEYELENVIGNGSYGQVVHGRNRVTGQSVAIKLLKDVFSSEYDVMKVIREIQLLRHFRQMDPEGKFVSKLIDIEMIEVQSGVIYLFIIQEHIRTDLRKMLDGENGLCLTEEYMMRILYGMLCSLNFIHSANVMHRDIKPANLLIGEDLSVKLCDFGLSRSIHEPDVSKINFYKKKGGIRHRRLSNHVVSRWYRPPEIILIQKHYT